MIRAAVLGSPIAQSLSPALHNRAYQILGISGLYERFEVRENELRAFLTGISDSDNDAAWSGFSLTMPLKESVCAIVKDIDPIAARIQSCNTIIFNGSQMRALSTDILGFRTLFDQIPLIRKESTVSLLGAGGTARAALAALDGVVDNVKVFTRSPARSKQIIDSLVKSQVEIFPWNQLHNAFSSDLIISTVPADVSSEISLLLPSPLPSQFLIDVLYHPWPTPILSRWRGNGGASMDGLDLLVAQALDQIALMTTKSFDYSQMKSLLRAEGLLALHR